MANRTEPVTFASKDREWRNLVMHGGTGIGNFFADDLALLRQRVEALRDKHVKLAAHYKAHGNMTQEVFCDYFAEQLDALLGKAGT